MTAETQPREYVGSVSAEDRLARWQADVIAGGGHPLGYRGATRLEDTLDRAYTPGDRKGAPATCGTCRFLPSRGRRKCTLPGPAMSGSRLRQQPRNTREAASDVQGWWPACEAYRPDLYRLARACGVPASQLRAAGWSTT
jgi:hypothetical protein